MRLSYEFSEISDLMNLNEAFEEVCDAISELENNDEERETPCDMCGNSLDDYDLDDFVTRDDVESAIDDALSERESEEIEELSELVATQTQIINELQKEIASLQTFVQGLRKAFGNLANLGNDTSDSNEVIDLELEKIEL